MDRLKPVISRLNEMEGLRPVVAGIGAAGIFAPYGSSLKDVTEQLRADITDPLRANTRRP
jgi:hypothetical protein